MQLEPDPGVAPAHDTEHHPEHPGRAPAEDRRGRAGRARAPDDAATDPRLFDSYAWDYEATVQRAIGASGESVRFFAELKAELTRRALAARPAARILDFGCGIGNTSRALRDAFPRATVTGFDPSRESIEVARKLTGGDAGRVRFASGGGDRLPFADGSFDLTFTSCVFHHIERDEHRRWARELWRVLEPGAPFFLFEHNPFNPLTVRAVRNTPFDEGVVLLRPGYTASLLRRAGFEASRPHFYFFFPRPLARLRPAEAALDWLPLGAQYYVVGRRPGAQR